MNIKSKNLPEKELSDIINNVVPHFKEALHRSELITSALQHATYTFTGEGVLKVKVPKKYLDVIDHNRIYPAVNALFEYAKAGPDVKIGEYEIVIDY